MRDADKWVLEELENLAFAPYGGLLPRVREDMTGLREIGRTFQEGIADALTKRQSVGLGLLARTYQLSMSCLVNQLLQDHAGWSTSYRSLIETFFVVDWIRQDAQRFEAYFEGTAPGIGKIKADCCNRHAEYAELYESASQVAHVADRALHLAPSREASPEGGFPFTVTELSIPGPLLAEMLERFANTLRLLKGELKGMLIDDFALTECGEVLWQRGETKAKFGCLGWKAREPEGQSESDDGEVVGALGSDHGFGVGPR